MLSLKRVLIGAFLIFAFPTLAQQAKIPKGAESSEVAIRTYFDALARQDLSGITDLSSEIIRATKTDFVAVTERLGTALLVPSYAPNTSDIYRSINHIAGQARTANQAKLIIYGLLSKYGDQLHRPIKMDKGETSKFIADVRADKLRDLKILKIAHPKITPISGNKADRVKEAQQFYPSFQDYEIFLVLLQVRDDKFMVGLQSEKFDGSWYISAATSATGVPLVLANPIRVTSSEFEALAE